MNERHSDFVLLREFVREGSQPAFAALVRTHLDMVYGTALRKVEDCGAAEEVAQNVFSALARKAWRFAPDDSVPAWLHKTTLLESKFWLRGELRRRRREDTAAELGTTMSTPEDHAAFGAIVPLLDEALLSLREKDRTALLLRYCERRSLRDVGAAFGVNEKTAQKRVQGALEKLAEFFKRRGYKTATVAATAAALQHTTTSVSATVVSAVIGAALRASPPALVGLSALVARLASLSRVQTVALCVVLAVVPVIRQSKQRQATAADVEQNRAQLVLARNNHANVVAEIDRLQQASNRLEQSLEQANEVAARSAESARAFMAWKKRTRALLTGADNRWDDDSPFARIPKAVLPELSELSGVEPFSPPGVVLPYARELMGLTVSERLSVEEVLRQHFKDVEARLSAGIRETNVTSPGRIPQTALAASIFIVPPFLDHEAKQSGDVMLTKLQGILGQERWSLIEARLFGQSSVPHLLRSILSQSQQDLALWVESDSKGTLSMGYGFNGSVATMGKRPLAVFLPEGHSGRVEGAEDFGAGFLSNAMRERALSWLQQQAIARLSNEATR